MLGDLIGFAFRLIVWVLGWIAAILWWVASETAGALQAVLTVLHVPEPLVALSPIILAAILFLLVPGLLSLLANAKLNDTLQEWERRGGGWRFFGNIIAAVIPGEEKYQRVTSRRGMTVLMLVLLGLLFVVRVAPSDSTEPPPETASEGESSDQAGDAPDAPPSPAPPRPAPKRPPRGADRIPDGLGGATIRLGPDDWYHIDSTGLVDRSLGSGCRFHQVDPCEGG